MTKHADKDRGLVFYHVFPVGLGIAYGLFGRGFIPHLPWWCEALFAGFILAVSHVVTKSYLWHGYLKNHSASAQRHHLLLFLSLAFLWDSAIILIVAVLVLSLRRLLA